MPWPWTIRGFGFEGRVALALVLVALLISLKVKIKNSDFMNFTISVRSKLFIYFIPFTIGLFEIIKFVEC